MTAIIDKRLFFSLTIAFIIATVVGTLAHETGHYFVAKYLGYDASINYGFTRWTLSSTGQAPNASDNFWITLGGTLSTILTGTIGLVLIFLFYQSYSDVKRLSSGQWFLIFVTLFWLRQTANFLVWVGSYLITGKFSQRGDEVKLALYAQLPEWSISALTAIIGAMTLAIVIFKLVPKIQRLTFVSSGLAGGISGYFIWLVLFGKYIMP
ncbi:MAG: hypothetical protein ABI763_02195 [Bacteroidota bacterium]